MVLEKRMAAALAKSVSMIVAALIAALVIYIMYTRFLKSRVNRLLPSVSMSAAATSWTADANNTSNQQASSSVGDNGMAGTEQAGVGPAPLDFPSFAATEDTSYFADFPRGQDPSENDGQPSAYDLNLSAMMPASWRGDAGCSSSDAGDGWSRYAPSREQFAEQVIAAGSARLGLSTRARNPNGGIPYLLRSAPPVPMSGGDIPFNDSSFRQDMVYNSLGFYPTQANCGV